jgi:hypothetical protein
MQKRFDLRLLVSGFLAISQAAHAAPPSNTGILFDDFSYSAIAELEKGGWKQRSKAGHPGVAGATWSPHAISLVEDSAHAHNRLLRLQASTDGTGPNTTQSQICHARKYLEGTYAARVRFSDTPATGPDGDILVQSFYAVSPLKHDFDPEFSEVDWEYLPNGGWGDKQTRLYGVTWQTVRIDPWLAFNQTHQVIRPLGGWHTLILQVAKGRTRHILDGVLLGEHGGRNYPAVPMSINFNLWFVPDGQLPGVSSQRTYEQDVDWVLHTKDKVLSPTQVDAMVKKMRRNKITALDTVAPASPMLDSNCDF